MTAYKLIVYILRQCAGAGNETPPQPCLSPICDVHDTESGDEGSSQHEVAADVHAPSDGASLHPSGDATVLRQKKIRCFMLWSHRVLIRMHTFPCSVHSIVKLVSFVRMI
jgi:hypothetical protein